MFRHLIIGAVMAAFAVAASAQQFPAEAGHDDRAVAGRRDNRHHHARARRSDREVPRAAGHRREQAGRVRHARRGGDAEREARRLHHHPDPGQRLPAAAHREDAVRPADRPHLHPRHLRVHLRRRRPDRGAMEDLGRVRRVREDESGQDLLRHARCEHQPPHHDGGDRVQAGAQVGARAAQGQRAGHGRPARRAHRFRRRLDRLGSARAGREGTAAGDLGREPHQALARGARR